MKRILPILIVLSLLGAVFICLPKSSEKTINITSLDELNGCRVGVQTGTAYELYLSQICPQAEPAYFNDFPSMIPALEQGKISALLTESVSFYVEQMESPGLVCMDEPLATVSNACGISRDAVGNAVFPQINSFIDEYTQDGTRDAMYDRWFTNYDRGNTIVDKSGITGENGILIFAAEASDEPLCFVGDGGELQGYDVEFIYRFCRKFGYEPEIILLEYDTLTTALTGGKCTVAMGISQSEERAEAIRFSNTYYEHDIIVAYNTEVFREETFFEHLTDSFSKTFLREDRWRLFVKGIGNTLLISFLAIIFGTVLGLALYLWCANGKKAEQKVTAVLCWLVSSTPTVVLLMVLYYIVFSRYLISNISVAVIGFTLFFGCCFYEQIASGIKLVGKGQEEAAHAQGFTTSQTFFHILFPQAACYFMPGYQNDVISLIQETSVVGYITVMDLTKMSDLVRGRTFEAFFPLLATAGIYFLIIWLVTLLLKCVGRLANSRNRKPERIIYHLKRKTGRDINTYR